MDRNIDPADEHRPVKAVIFDYDVIPFPGARPDTDPGSVIVGFVANDGNRVAIRTSILVSLDESSGIARTRNSVYALEGPRNPDAARNALAVLRPI